MQWVQEHLNTPVFKMQELAQKEHATKPVMINPKP